MSTEEWQTDVNEAVRARSLLRGVGGCTELHVFLSSMPHEWFDESEIRQCLLACLNERAAFLSRLDGDVEDITIGEASDSPRLDAEDEYFEPIRELINQINKPSDYGVSMVRARAIFPIPIF